MKQIERIFPELSDVERLQILQDTALDVADNFFYQRELTDEEIEEARLKFVEFHLQMEQLERKKREFLENFKAEFDPIKKEAGSTLEILETGRENRTGTVFFMQDFDDRKIKIYDHQGFLVGERAMKPTDRQQNIFSGAPGRKTGTE